MDRQNGGVTREFSAVGHAFRCFLFLLAVSAVAALLIVLMAGGAVPARRVPPGAPGPAALWVCLAVCGVSAVYFGVLALWYLKRPFLTLAPDGLRVRRFGHGPEFYPWRDFDAAKVTNEFRRRSRFSYLVLTGPHRSKKLDICHLSQREYPALEAAARACIEACREA